MNNNVIIDDEKNMKERKNNMKRKGGMHNVDLICSLTQTKRREGRQ